MQNVNKENYADNGKISSRQTQRLFVFDLMGIATLLLPPYLVKLCGGSGAYAILLGIGAGFLYLFYLGWIMKKMQTDMTSYLKERSNPWIGKIIFLLVMLHSILTAGFCAYVFANLMQYSLVRETAYETILFLIVLVAAYAVSGGIESRARVYEVLFWFILVPYIGMMLAAVRDCKWEYLAPVMDFDGTNLGMGIYLVFLFFSPLFFSLFLIREKEKNYEGNIVKTVGASILISGAILLGSYVILLGSFGEKGLANLRFPVVTLMSTIQFEGNFLKRMDALMLAVWFFTLYALLNLHLHYGVRMLVNLSPKQNGKRKWWQLILPAGVVFLVAYAMHLDGRWVRWFLAYYSYGAVPFMVVAPTMVLCCGRMRLM